MPLCTKVEYIENPLLWYDNIRVVKMIEKMWLDATVSEQKYSKKIKRKNENTGCC